MALLAGVSPAQKSEGPLLGLPQVMLFDALSPVGTPGVLQWKGIGFATTAPAAWAPAPAQFPAVPDFATLFGGPRQIDGISSGYDWVWSLPDGTASPEAGDWGAITFSVTRGTLGDPAGKIAGEVAAADGAAADVWANVLPGSLLPADLVGVTFRALDSTEFGAFAPGQPADLVAHDLLLGLIYRENPQLVAALPFRAVFFTVTAADAPNVPAAWWGTPPAPVSGATILRTDWTGSSWTTPAPFLLPADLGLGDQEDVDALAVDFQRGRVLFSTARIAGQPLRDPLLFAQLGIVGHSVYRLPPDPLRPLDPPVPVSQHVGLRGGGGGPDDIDGICSLDPTRGFVGTGPRLRAAVGAHEPPLGPVANQLSSSVFRRWDPAQGSEVFTTLLTGWPPPGTPSPGFAIAAFRVPGTGLPFQTGLFVPRPTGSPFQGHPERFDLAIPPQFSGLDLDVEFVWAALSATDLDVSEPVRIAL
ncbi:MAG: hypothetical protein AB7O97_04460 [Planctomycetota bacterium]